MLAPIKGEVTTNAADRTVRRVRVPVRALRYAGQALFFGENRMLSPSAIMMSGHNR